MADEILFDRVTLNAFNVREKRPESGRESLSLADYHGLRTWASDDCTDIIPGQQSKPAEARPR